VWGYNDWIKATEEEGRWDLIDWGSKGKKSGAKSVETKGVKTIYIY
jgi:hypothetical protein